MSQLADLYTSENERLFNLLFRKQVYLEGVKAGFAGDYQKILRELYKTFATYMMQSKYQQIDGFTKLELALFIKRFQDAQARFYSIYTQQLIDLLQQFLTVDVDATRAIMHTVTGEYPDTAYAGPANIITPKEYDQLGALMQTNYTQSGKEYTLNEDTNDYTGNTPLLGIATTHGTDESNARLWSFIANAPMPANGVTIQKSIDYWTQANAAAVFNQINKSYANKQSTRQTLDAIVGNPAKGFQDGLFATFQNQNAALLATILQHVTSMSGAAISSVYYERYQWVAILDNVTTEICRSRNGNVYTYGDGPLPPAHYNCRSKDVPLAGDQAIHDIPQDYVSWIMSQPESFMRDALGSATAEKIMNGTINEGSFSLIGSVKPLTLEQFVDKLPFILGE